MQFWIWSTGYINSCVHSKWELDPWSSLCNMQEIRYCNARPFWTVSCQQQERISFMVSQMERWFSVTNLKSDTFVNFFFSPHHEWSIHCRRMSKICQKFPIQVGAREHFILSWKGIGSVCDFPHSLTSWLWSSCHSTKWISGELYRHNRGFRGILQLWSTYGSRGEDESCVHCEWVVFKPCQLKLHYRYVKIPSYTINS